MHDLCVGALLWSCSRQLSMAFVWYSCIKPPLWKLGVSSNSCLVWQEFQKQNTFWIPKNCCHGLSDWLLHTKFLRNRGPLVCVHCMDSCLVSGLWWWTHVSFPVLILEKKFYGFALSMSKFSSLNCWWLALCLGVNIHSTHHELTFDIIKTEWMILETVPVEMPSSWTITLTLTRHLQNHILHFLAHFLWRCFHWPTWTWIVFN